MRGGIAIRGHERHGAGSRASAGVRRATIADVARHAGVSKGLVSFVINDRPGVATATRRRVLDSVEQLGWRPNQAARSLTTSRAYAVGLVLARPADLLAADPFFPAFIAGAGAELSARDSALVLQVVRDASAEAAAYRRLAADRRVDGVIVADLRVDDPRPALLAELDLAAVTLGHPDRPSGSPAIAIDDGPGVADAVRHLADLGHERIAFVGGPPQFLHARRRHDTCAAARRELGLPDDAALDVDGDFSGESGAAATARLVELPPRRRPTAVIFANDLMAIAGIAELGRRSWRVPDHLSIIGFDNVPVAAHLHPALTTVAQDAVAWGQAATRALFDLVETGTGSDVELPPTRLVVRASTGARPTTRITTQPSGTKQPTGNSHQGDT